jgi:hypothetical protein
MENNHMNLHPRKITTVLAALVALTLQAAAAETTPPYATTDEAIHGSVSSINGRALSLRDERGFVDNVALHAGTIITPTGIELEPGQAITVHGHADGGVFRADEIDAYAVSYAQPYAADPYVAYADPYLGYPDPYFGYGYGYGYGYDAFFGSSVFFGFGDRGFRDRGFRGHDFSGRGFSGRGFSGGGARGGHR